MHHHLQCNVSFQADFVKFKSQEIIEIFLFLISKNNVCDVFETHSKNMPLSKILLGFVIWLRSMMIALINLSQSVKSHMYLCNHLVFYTLHIQTSLQIPTLVANVERIQSICFHLDENSPGVHSEKIQSSI